MMVDGSSSDSLPASEGGRTGERGQAVCGLSRQGEVHHDLALQVVFFSRTFPHVHSDSDYILNPEYSWVCY